MSKLDKLMTRALGFAYDLGMNVGENHANWVEQDLFGGRYTGDQRKAARAVLKTLDEGYDHGLYDGLPDLSGEWADGPTPQSVLSQVLHALDVKPGTKQADHVEEFLDDICNEWSLGVQSGFECELHRLATEAAKE